ncbi:MAG: hypothetical protein CMB67_02305 [Euryarchaeota archaeon]|nr:hypothetical protein [Euryarchaeota archaeon]
MSILISPVSSQQNSASNRPIVDLDIEEGQTIPQETTIYGQILYADNIISVTWEIVDSSGSRGFHDISEDILVENSNGISINSFQITIDPHSTGTCSCIIIITLSFADGDPIYFSRSIFIQSDSFPDWIAEPTIHIQNMPNSWASGILEVYGISSTNSGINSQLFFSIKQSTGANCLNSDADLLTSSDQIQITDVVWSSGSFRTNISVSHLNDGTYQLTIFSNDTSTGLFSYDCVPVRVDNTNPNAIISGENKVFESNDLINFDGSSTTDEYWGVEGITYVWSISKISDGIIENIIIESGGNSLSPEILTNISGFYLVTLNAVDRAGNQGSETLSFEITNLHPVARLIIDSEEVSNGQEIEMEKISTISIDASLSYDTENDQDNLRYVWRINNVPIYQGITRDIEWPNSDSNQFLLTLEVIDDNSETSIISVLIIDSENTGSAIIPIIVLFSSIIFLLYATNKYKSNDTESDIPKWN